MSTDVQIRSGDMVLNSVFDEKIEKRSASQAHRSLILSFLFLIVCIFSIAILIWFSLNQMNHYSDIINLKQLDLLNLSELDSMEKVSVEYCWWNEAVDAIMYQHDVMFLEENYPYLLETYDLSRVLIFSETDELIYSISSEAIEDSASVDLFDSSFETMKQEALTTDLEDPGAASGIMKIGDNLEYTAVMAFVNYEPSEHSINKTHGYMVLTRLISPELLSDWSESFNLSDLTMIPVNTPEDVLKANMDGGIHKDILNADSEIIGIIQLEGNKINFNFYSHLTPRLIPVLGVILFACALFVQSFKKYRIMTSTYIHTVKNTAERLIIQANFDDLTGLVNRHYFSHKLDQIIASCIRYRRISSLLYIDLDDFKQVNDTSGHEYGDEVLKVVATRLKNIVRIDDTVARFGGDEFCILLEELNNQEDASMIATKIRESVSNPIEINGKIHYVGASIGIVSIPGDGKDAATLLRYADIAMYHAKAKGENNFNFYSPDLENKSQERVIIKNCLYSAVPNDEFSLLYQPIYNLTDNKMAGMEALLRWDNDELGKVSPEKFISLAEEMGIIREIGDWVIDHSFCDYQKILQETGQQIKLSVNVSVKQLDDDLFPQRFENLLKKYSLDPSLIQVEITENMLVIEEALEHHVLNKLIDLGVHLAIDDFGTGYSSLSYIQKFNVSAVKIDKSFVLETDSDNPKSEQNRSLIRAIVYMAEAFGMSIIAEGIETEEHQDFLKTTQCTYGQGFLYSRPVPLAAIIERLKGN